MHKSWGINDEWLKTRLVKDPTSRLWNSEAYKDYGLWCVERVKPVCSKQMFGRKLREFGYILGKSGIGYIAGFRLPAPVAEPAAALAGAQVDDTDEL